MDESPGRFTSPHFTQCLHLLHVAVSGAPAKERAKVLSHLLIFFLVTAVGETKYTTQLGEDEAIPCEVLDQHVLNCKQLLSLIDASGCCR